MQAEPDDIAKVAAWIQEASKVVVLTGAGISTDSGIPDFRGPQGMWTKNPEAMKLSDIGYYMTDSQVRVDSWRARLDSPIWAAEPNPGHLALAEFERKGHLDLLVTQNVDGLHLSAGTSPGRLVEIHGTAREVVCMECGERAPMQRALDRVRAGEEDPPCRTCGGILKSATISFGQMLVPEDIHRAEAGASSCDLFLSVGSSLIVFPVAELPAIALRAGARLVIMNEEPTPYDAHADAVLQGRISEVLPPIVAAL